MGAIDTDNYKRMSLKNIAVVIHDMSSLKALAASKKAVKLHLEIDTGMSRHGLNPKDLRQFLSELKKHPKLKVEGVMSHLADADNPKTDDFTKHQVKLYDEAVDLILEQGFSPIYFHIAQSAGSVKVKSRHANTLRIGAAIYGVNPLEKTDKAYAELNKTKPALELRSTITKVIKAEKGTKVSYGLTFTATKLTNIGVMPLGYYEGIPRKLSNEGLAEHSGKYYKIAGRVCMNHTMLDLQDDAIKVGDKMTLISRDPKSKVSLDNVCQRHGLYEYEVIVNLNQNIRRKIVA
jgi:alanine racemase